MAPVVFLYRKGVVHLDWPHHVKYLSGFQFIAGRQQAIAPARGQWITRTGQLVP
jgi:hypothetical protein